MVPDMGSLAGALLRSIERYGEDIGSGWLSLGDEQDLLQAAEGTGDWTRRPCASPSPGPTRAVPPAAARSTTAVCLWRRGVLWLCMHASIARRQHWQSPGPPDAAAVHASCARHI
jgi:hypothetical protein